MRNAIYTTAFIILITIWLLAPIGLIRLAQWADAGLMSYVPAVLWYALWQWHNDFLGGWKTTRTRTRTHTKTTH